MQDAVLDSRFGESRRTTAKRKINSAIYKLWPVQQWSFKRRVPLSISVSTDLTLRRAYLVTTTESIEEILGCYDEDNNPLLYMEPDKFEEEYEGADSGTPEAFTIYGTDANLHIRFGPPSDAARTYKLPYRMGPPTLSADADNLSTYGWPATHHEIVVVDARIALLRDENDPTWRELSPERKELFDAMVDVLSVESGGETREFGADKLGYGLVS